jgi:hypothetical protein
VKYLVEKGADVNKVTDMDETPLMVSSARGYLDIVKFLHKYVSLHQHVF